MAAPPFLLRAYSIATTWCGDSNGYLFRVTLSNGEVVESPPSSSPPIEPQDGFIEFDTQAGTRLIPFSSILVIEAVFVSASRDGHAP